MERCHELLDRHKLVLVFDLVNELYDRGIVRSWRAGALPQGNHLAIQIVDLRLFATLGALERGAEHRSLAQAARKEDGHDLR